MTDDTPEHAAFYRALGLSPARELGCGTYWRIMIGETDERPSETTLAALNEIAEMDAHPEQYKRYDSFQELLDECQ